MHLWQNVYTGHEAPNGGVMESWDWSKVAPQHRHPEAEARFYKSRHNRENLWKICGYIILGRFIFLNMMSGVRFNNNQLTLSKVRRCSTPTERPCASCAYQWPLQPLLLLRLKVTHSSVCCVLTSARWAYSILFVFLVTKYYFYKRVAFTANGACVKTLI